MPLGSALRSDAITVQLVGDNTQARSTFPEGLHPLQYRLLLAIWNELTVLRHKDLAELLERLPRWLSTAPEVRLHLAAETALAGWQPPSKWSWRSVVQALQCQVDRSRTAFTVDGHHCRPPCAVGI